MALHEFDTETGSVDISATITVLTDTPDAANARMCHGVVILGTTNALDGTGGAFELTVSVGGVLIEPDPQILGVSAGATTARFETAPFAVEANAAVLLRVKSPNGADVNVTYVSYLHDANSANLTAISGDTVAADNAETAFDGGAYNVGGGAIVAASTGGVVAANVMQINNAIVAAMRLEDWMSNGYTPADNAAYVDVRFVAGAAVTGIADFRATGFAVAGDAMALTADALTAAAVSAGAVTKIQAGLATATNVAAITTTIVVP